MSNLICDTCGRPGGQDRECLHVICRECWAEAKEQCPICKDESEAGEP